MAKQFRTWCPASFESARYWIYPALFKAIEKRSRLSIDISLGLQVILDADPESRVTLAIGAVSKIVTSRHPEGPASLLQQVDIPVRLFMQKASARKCDPGFAYDWNIPAALTARV